MKYFIATLLLISQMTVHSLHASEMPDIPGNPNEAVKEEIWNKYCNATKNVKRMSLDIPVVNYNDDAVRSAATKLVEISPYSYYFYSGPLNAYKLVQYGPKDPASNKSPRELIAPPTEGPGKFRINDTTAKNRPVIESKTNKDPIIGRRNAHAFLTVLCGEFRDRPTLIKDKIKWVNNMYTLRNESPQRFNPGKNNNVWGQLSAQSYPKYINITRQIFAAKEAAAPLVTNKGSDGKVFKERSGVKPFSVCETKFILTKYVTGEYALPMKRPDLKKPKKVSVSQMPKTPMTETEVEQDETEFEDEEFSTFHGGVDLRAYQNSYAGFKQGANHCNLPKEDEEFYDFRGDSNFKPNSPESNGMIWYSSTIGGACVRNKSDSGFTLKKGMEEQFKEDPAICEKYFKEPFRYRWSAARAGLATWMMRDTKYDHIFSESNENVTVMPHLDPMSKPFNYRFLINEPYKPEYYEPFEKNEEGKYYTEKWVQDPVTKEGEYKKIILEGEKLAEALTQIEEAKVQYENEMKNYEVALAAYKEIANAGPLNAFMDEFNKNKDVFWKRGDLGFSTIFKVSPNSKGETGDAFERIRDAVNRHTDWYASAYDDGAKNPDGTPKVRDQAYSPFVASSYEMSASDGFTSPGVTVNSPADGCKHWMFIFKLPMKNWMSFDKLRSGKTEVNFNTQWFDETSFGTNHLADSERALDRLGTALEEEMDSILYLNNITTSGKVDEKCGEDKVATYIY